MGSSLSEGGSSTQLVSGRHFSFMGLLSSPTLTEVGSERLKWGQLHFRMRRLAIVVFAEQGAQHGNAPCVSAAVSSEQTDCWQPTCSKKALQMYYPPTPYSKWC